VETVFIQPAAGKSSYNEIKKST